MLRSLDSIPLNTIANYLQTKTVVKTLDSQIHNLIGDQLNVTPGSDESRQLTQKALTLNMQRFSLDWQATLNICFTDNDEATQAFKSLAGMLPSLDENSAPAQAIKTRLSILGNLMGLNENIVDKVLDASEKFQEAQTKVQQYIMLAGTEPGSAESNSLHELLEKSDGQ